MSAPKRQRKWNESDVKTENRNVRLFLAGASLLVVVAVFLWWILRDHSRQTLLASISIEEFNDGFPSVREWNGEGLIESLDSNGLLLWGKLSDNQGAAGRLQTSENIKTRLRNLRESARRESKPNDTLVLTLRTHALAVERNGTLECQLKMAGSEPLMFQELLTELADFPNRNLLVLADICDLQFLPERGVVLNPIVQAIHQDCVAFHRESEKNSQNLWILLSTGDGGTTHVVSKGTAKGETLFQKACEVALQIQDSNELNLATYYEQILDSSSIASKNTQLPVLLNSRLCNETLFDSSLGHPMRNKELWQEAKRVELSWRSKRKKASELPEEPEPIQNQTAQLSPENPSQNGILQEKSLDDMNFWELASSLDELQIEQKTWQWSPALFSPRQWRSFLKMVAERPNQDSVRTELLDLVRAIQSGTPSNARDSSLLSIQVRKDWNAFCEHPYKTHWESFYDAKQSQQWNAIRAALHRYAIAQSQTLQWRRWWCDESLSRSTSNELAWNQVIEELHRAQQEILKHLDPGQASASNWRSMEQLASFPSDSWRAFREDANRVVDSLINQESTQWTWFHARCCEELLSIPLIDQQRRRLLSEKSLLPVSTKLTRSDLPPENSWNGLRDRSMMRADSFLQSESRLESFWNDKAEMRRSQNVLTTEELVRQTQEWFKRQTTPSSESFYLWHYLALSDLKSGDQLPRGVAGLVFFPGAPKTVVLSANQEFVDCAEQEQKLVLNVKHLASVDPVEPFELRWTAESSNLAASVQVRSSDQIPWRRNEWAEAKPVNGQLEMKIQFLSPYTPAPEDRLVLTWKDSRSGVVSSSLLEIPVVRNPKDLILSFTPKKSSGVSLQPKKIEKLDVPTLPNSQVEIDFEVANWQKSNRAAQLMLFRDASFSPESLLASSTVVNLEGAKNRQPSKAKFANWEHFPEMEKPESIHRVYWKLMEFEPTASPSPENNSPNTQAPRSLVSETFGQIQLEPIPIHQFLEIETDPQSDTRGPLQVGSRPIVIVKPKARMWEAYDIQQIELALRRARPASGTLSDINSSLHFTLEPIPEDQPDLYSLDSGKEIGVCYIDVHTPGTVVNQKWVTYDTLFHGRWKDEISLILVARGAQRQADDDDQSYRWSKSLVVPTWTHAIKKERLEFESIDLLDPFEFPPRAGIKWELKNLSTQGDAANARESAEWEPRQYSAKISRSDTGSVVVQLKPLGFRRSLPLGGIQQKAYDNGVTKWLLTLDTAQRDKEIENNPVPLEIVLDYEPPVIKNQNDFPPEIDLADGKLSEIFLSADDQQGSGILEGRFCISRSNLLSESNLEVWENLDWSEREKRFSFGKIRDSLKGKPGGTYFLHVVVFDRAGNQTRLEAVSKILWAPDT